MVKVEASIVTVALPVESSSLTARPERLYKPGGSHLLCFLLLLLYKEEDGGVTNTTPSTLSYSLPVGPFACCNSNDRLLCPTRDSRPLDESSEWHVNSLFLRLMDAAPSASPPPPIQRVCNGGVLSNNK